MPHTERITIHTPESKLCPRGTARRIWAIRCSGDVLIETCREAGGAGRVGEIAVLSRAQGKQLGRWLLDEENR